PAPADRAALADASGTTGDDAGEATVGAASGTAGDTVRPESDADVSTAALRQAATALREQLTAARAAAADGPRVARERRRLPAPQQPARPAPAPARAAAARLPGRAGGAEVQLTPLRARSDAARQGFPAVAARVSTLQHQATYLEKATGAHEADVAA